MATSESPLNRLWTIGQLTEQVASILGPTRRLASDRGGKPDSTRVRPASSGEPERTRHQKVTVEASAADAQVERTSGRVREVPDARTVRWYQTTGLVDRPAAMNGRTALYGGRHLLQLLAIKRLQGQGKSLATIQAELAGASDTELAAFAGELALSDGVVGGTPEGAPAVDTAPGGSPTHRTESTADAVARTRFWAVPPTAPGPQALAPGAQPGSDDEEPLVGVRVHPGITVLIDRPTRPLDGDDQAALRQAAQPLVEAVRRRHLTTPPRDQRGGERP